MTDIVPVLRAPTPDNPSSVSYPGKPAGWTPPPTLPVSGGGNDAQKDGFAYLQSVLADYGLEELSGWAWDQIVAGNSPTMVMQELRKQPAYQRRFRVIFERQKLGLAPMSPSEVIAYEKSAHQMLRAAGLPPGFYDSREDFEAFMIGDVSLAELSDRVEQARVWAYQTDAVTRAEMDRLYAGSSSMLSPEYATAYFLDPQKALPLIMRQVVAARTSGSAVRSGFGNLSRSEAEWLADLGIDPNQATSGFGELVSGRELFSSLPGEAGDTIGRQDQLDAAFGGDRIAQERIDRQARARRAVFGGGGGYAQSQEGFAGLGSAS